MGKAVEKVPEDEEEMAGFLLWLWSWQLGSWICLFTALLVEQQTLVLFKGGPVWPKYMNCP